MTDFKCAKSYVCFTLLTCLMLLLGGCLQVHPFRGRRHTDSMVQDLCGAGRLNPAGGRRGVQPTGESCELHTQRMVIALSTVLVPGEALPASATIISILHIVLLRSAFQDTTAASKVLTCWGVVCSGPTWQHCSCPPLLQATSALKLSLTHPRPQTGWRA